MSTNLRDDPQLRALTEQAVVEAKEAKGFTFWDLTDDSLLRVRRQYQRMIEDNPGRAHGQIDAWLASIRWVRLVRWCLHMRYRAIDDHLGTHSFDRYHRFDDPPSYTLARDMDYYRWQVGARHIIDWDRWEERTPNRMPWGDAA
jgi:hypothetical protein